MRLVVALLLTTPATVFACETFDIKVLPFEPRYDYTRPARELAPNVGQVSTTGRAVIDGCTATVGYVDPVVSVAVELTKDACAVAHVTRHEEEHLAIYREALSSMAVRIKLRAPEVGLERAIAEFFDGVRAKQDAFDSPAEYRMNITACSGRIASLVGIQVAGRL